MLQMLAAGLAALVQPAAAHQADNDTVSCELRFQVRTGWIEALSASCGDHPDAHALEALSVDQLAGRPRVQIVSEREVVRTIDFVRTADSDWAVAATIPLVRYRAEFPSAMIRSERTAICQVRYTVRDGLAEADAVECQTRNGRRRAFETAAREAVERWYFTRSPQAHQYCAQLSFDLDGYEPLAWEGESICSRDN